MLVLVQSLQGPQTSPSPHLLENERGPQSDRRQVAASSLGIPSFMPGSAQPLFLEASTKPSNSYSTSPMCQALSEGLEDGGQDIVTPPCGTSGAARDINTRVKPHWCSSWALRFVPGLRLYIPPLFLIGGRYTLLAPFSRCGD